MSIKKENIYFDSVISKSYYDQTNKHTIPTEIKKYCHVRRKVMDLNIYKIMSNKYRLASTPKLDERPDYERLSHTIERYLEDTCLGDHVVNDGGRGLNAMDPSVNGGNSNIIKLYTLLTTQPTEYFAPMSYNSVIGEHPGGARMSLLSFYKNPTLLTMVLDHNDRPVDRHKTTEFVDRMQEQCISSTKIDNTLNDEKLFNELNLHKLHSNSIQLKLMKYNMFEISEDHTIAKDFVEYRKYNIKITDNCIFIDGKWAFRKCTNTNLWSPNTTLKKN